MDGINSSRAWDMAMDIRRTPRTSGDRKAKIVADDANTNAPTVLTWIPGTNPVKVPQRTPIMQAKIRSKILIPSRYYYNTYHIKSITIWVVGMKLA